jgi:hypothetical protein
VPAWDRMPLLEVQTEGQAVQVASFTEVPALPRAAPHTGGKQDASMR